MIEQIKREILEHGHRAEIVSVKSLGDIRQDAEYLNNSGLLNNYQKDIINSHFTPELPGIGFEARSVIIVASPSPSRVIVTFNRQGKRIPLTIPATYVDYHTAPEAIERYLKEFLEPLGYHVKFVTKLPRKLLAVRSGLALYGRNNICYVDGMGSFVNITSCISDVPCPEEHLREARRMDICERCTACMGNCPTGAISDGRFLINTDRCLTFFNEAGGEHDFPEWIDPSWHNCVVGCLKCQEVCPKDRRYLDAIAESVEFTEEETSLLLEGRQLDELPGATRLKVEELEMVSYLDSLPRNLKALFSHIPL